MAGKVLLPEHNGGAVRSNALQRYLEASGKTLFVIFVVKKRSAAQTAEGQSNEANSKIAIFQPK